MTENNERTMLAGTYVSEEYAHASRKLFYNFLFKILIIVSIFCLILIYIHNGVTQ